MISGDSHVIAPFGPRRNALHRTLLGQCGHRTPQIVTDSTGVPRSCLFSGRKFIGGARLYDVDLPDAAIGAAQ